MRYKLNEKKEIRIPDEDIQRLMSTMKLDKDEAIQLWLEDEGYLINEEQEALCKKAKENKVKNIGERKAPIVLKNKKEKVVKDNPTKEMVISEIAKILPAFATNIKIENKAKLITFNIGDDEFKLDLIQKRKKKGE